MKKRFPEEQIIGLLREADAGMAVKDLLRDQIQALASRHRRYSRTGEQGFDGRP